MDTKLILESLERTSVVEALFTSAPPVDPGVIIANNLEFSAKFNQGKKLFFNGTYESAAEVFHQLDEILPAYHKIITPAKINESFCWLHLHKYDKYIERWEPLVELGRVYGVALWNLAFAFYKLGQVSKAEVHLKKWIESPSLWFLAKACLLLSVLQVRNGKIDEAIVTFNTALTANFNFCSRVISEYAGVDVALALLEANRPQRAPVARTIEVIAKDDVLEELSKLLVPRGPGKYPQLSQQLSEFEYQTGYMTALEKFGDGEIDEALYLIDSLVRGA